MVNFNSSVCFLTYASEQLVLHTPIMAPEPDGKVMEGRQGILYKVRPQSFKKAPWKAVGAFMGGMLVFKFTLFSYIKEMITENNDDRNCEVPPRAQSPHRRTMPLN